MNQTWEGRASLESTLEYLVPRDPFGRNREVPNPSCRTSFAPCVQRFQMEDEPLRPKNVVARNAPPRLLAIETARSGTRPEAGAFQHCTAIFVHALVGKEWVKPTSVAPSRRRQDAKLQDSSTPDFTELLGTRISLNWPRLHQSNLGRFFRWRLSQPVLQRRGLFST